MSLGTRDPWFLPEKPGMRQALDALKKEARPPTDADRPPPSTFPLTPAARAALRLSRRPARDA